MLCARILRVFKIIFFDNPHIDRISYEFHERRSKSLVLKKNDGNNDLKNDLKKDVSLIANRTRAPWPQFNKLLNNDNSQMRKNRNYSNNMSVLYLFVFLR